MFKSQIFHTMHINVLFNSSISMTSELLKSLEMFLS